MDKNTIIDEIIRTAGDNKGNALGQKQFERITGISMSQWRGKYWLKWNDAVIEAGLSTNQFNQAFPDGYALECLAELTSKLGHIPTYAEVCFARVEDTSFPASQVINRLGAKDIRTKLLRELAKNNSKFSHILSYLPEEDKYDALTSSKADLGSSIVEGHVYMLKLGKHFKIGKTNSVPRRHREINLELPEKTEKIHAIRTDDPEGIEAYWHKRFSEKRTNGEWFALSGEDVRIFKRRKFM